MIQRCCNPKHDAYKNYGGRGIKVCKRWHKFENFYEDMHPRPPNMQLDRINNNLGYSPKNVVWTTVKNNARNKRTNKFLIINGKKKTISEWAEISGVGKATIRQRVFKLKWDHQKAISATSRLSKKNNR